MLLFRVGEANAGLADSLSTEKPMVGASRLSVSSRSLAHFTNSNAYARFGFMCAFLEATPIVGTAIFPLTNAVAAALFACDIESCGGPSSLVIQKNREGACVTEESHVIVENGQDKGHGG
jgi:hypothetical protein